MRFINFLPGLLLAMLPLVLTTPLQAADADGNYAIWGMGGASCHAYSKARAADTDEAANFRYYIMGYLTAYNVHQPDTYSISADQSMPEILAWLDSFCDTHAVHSFDNALKNFIVEKYADRMTSMPHSGYGQR